MLARTFNDTSALAASVVLNFFDGISVSGFAFRLDKQIALLLFLKLSAGY